MTFLFPLSLTDLDGPYVEANQDACRILTRRGQTVMVEVLDVPERITWCKRFARVFGRQEPDPTIIKIEREATLEDHTLFRVPRWIRSPNVPECCGQPMFFIGQIDDKRLCGTRPSNAKRWWTDASSFYVFTCTQCRECKVVGQQTPSDAFDSIVELLRQELPFAESVSTFMNFIRATWPSPAWEKIGEIDFGADLVEHTKWLETVFREEPPPDQTKAYWFGLYATCEDEYVLYVSGADRYAEPDWPCSPFYFPEKRYAKSTGLTSLFRLTRELDSEIASDVEYVVILGYAAILVTAICSKVEPRLLADASGPRRVVVGFDSGDSIHVGRASLDGFEPDLSDN